MFINTLLVALSRMNLYPAEATVFSHCKQLFLYTVHMPNQQYNSHIMCVWPLAAETPSDYHLLTVVCAPKPCFAPRLSQWYSFYGELSCQVSCIHSYCNLWSQEYSNSEDLFVGILQCNWFEPGEPDDSAGLLPTFSYWRCHANDIEWLVMHWGSADASAMVWECFLTSRWHEATSSMCYTVKCHLEEYAYPSESLVFSHFYSLICS